ncbi:MAG: NAD+ synthase [Planctomycetota bacterium]|nr:NAD+ synthase [Planctomycetota bacterium]
MKRLADRIADWIAGRVKAAGAKGAVVGLSGGVDSAVVAALCRQALGKRVLGLIMPCESVPQDAEDAALIARTFRIRAETIHLDGVFRAFLDVLPRGTRGARANLKPRLRMATLYWRANSLGYVVAGTGNKSELMAGYFTKYGDGGVDILPIGGLYKTEVWELAREIGVPQRIIEKPPSAGLWAGQTDEGEMGISYRELDAALRALESGRVAATESGPDRRIMEKVRKMVAASAHKREMPPVFRPDGN